MPLLNSGQYALKWANGAKWVDLVEMIRAELLAELPALQFRNPLAIADENGEIHTHPWTLFCAADGCVVVEDEPDAEPLARGKKLGTPGE